MKPKSLNIMSWGQKWDTAANHIYLLAMPMLRLVQTAGTGLECRWWEALCCINSEGSISQMAPANLNNAIFLYTCLWSFPLWVMLSLTMWHILANGKYKIDSDIWKKYLHISFSSLGTLSLPWELIIIAHPPTCNLVRKTIVIVVSH